MTEEETALDLADQYNKARADKDWDKVHQVNTLANEKGWTIVLNDEDRGYIPLAAKADGPSTVKLTLNNNITEASSENTKPVKGPAVPGPMSRASMFTFMRNHVAECIALAERKNNDYSGASDDPFFNLRRGDLFGIAVRLDDKVSRLLSLTKGTIAGQVEESIEDTLDDIVNYGLLARALKEDLKGR